LRDFFALPLTVQKFSKDTKEIPLLEEVLIYPELTLFPLDPSKKLFFPW